MDILDENIPASQWQLLLRWRIRARRIGHEVGRQGMGDQEIPPLLRRLRRATFYTRDLDFYDRRLCHAGYCLVVLTVDRYEVASFIRRFLRHPVFDTQAKRLGKVVRVAHMGIHMWQLHAEREGELAWG